MELPATLVMSPGETLTFELPGLGGAGYLWFVEVSDTQPEAGSPSLGAELGEVVDAVLARSAPGLLGSAEHPQVGRGLPETLRLTAQTPGTAAVRMIQRRPWEDGPPRDERHLEVVVVAATTPVEADTDSTLDELPGQEDTQH
ncbi:protease inhibitor I42 family protein [Ornithinimicrobium cryptoxanthini]|uniref:Protease inhibitor I42 family protein n=1 Tax=Ornithinimicrobium cryptoxanthini TaxID=2934161 RepID=A0ABY4YHD3_9MICO|nr:protease inhibitor I42 family protein [Ornithinimicrobium cryptoxanthini]USQ75552.1 protease inhibitor I42 family protein [Ornithinimicrobium cryptoxanthini]